MDTDRDRDRDRSDRDRDHRGGAVGAGGADRRAPFDPHRKAVAREIAASEAAKRSRKECRVYVGNLAFGVKWNDLKDFMREAGNVVFAEIMLLPNGMSKGCGVVEYSTPEEAQRAIRELSDQQLLGRPVFVREDREDEARYGSAAISGRAGFMGPGATFPARGGFGGGFGGRGGFAGGAGFGGPVGGQGRHLYITGLPYTVGWQDLKDLFRAAGSIIRADVKMGPDGSHSGTGTVVYETAQDAQNAIAMYNGFEFQGSVLEVREDRFPQGGHGGGGFGGRGGFMGRGGFGGGFGGRGGFGGVAPGFGAGAYGYGAAAGFGAGGFGAGAGFAGVPAGPGGGAVMPPSQQIYVRNLPYSTSNEDLVELFQTTGTVEHAEVLFEHGRSKGAGIVQFATVEEAQTAITRFNGYQYGGRPLALDFNARWKPFGAPGAPTGTVDDAAYDASAVAGMEGVQAV
ncbi:heterogeneous nuclear ribonucleoprotein M [Rhodotorula toruloides]|uniref:Heterogeneous nuclear ribonucleoprotein M n=1 Tax=Rhodotorula toruloides TaxID=5286 RepID=A0A511KDH1_RHOTO|nr:heterogeneous nuclear ribonucleoprotein M [Rhodotorula toruloides]